MELSIIQNLKNKIQHSLPGIDAQYKMAHAVRQQKPRVPADARIACTLILVYPKNNEWHLVLIQRTSSNNPDDRHSGQVSLPGGQQEPIDISLSDTALREAHEEVGIDRSNVSLLGSLTELYIPVSNFIVHPFVAYTEDRPSFKLQASEVKSIIEVPLSLLQDGKTMQKTNIRITEKLILQNVPFYSVGGHVVWGATAMMLSEFLELM